MRVRGFGVMTRPAPTLAPAVAVAVPLVHGGAAGGDGTALEVGDEVGESPVAAVEEEEEGEEEAGAEEGGGEDGGRLGGCEEGGGGG